MFDKAIVTLKPDLPPAPELFFRKNISLFRIEFCQNMYEGCFESND